MAVLIDAESIDPSDMERLILMAGFFGKPVILRAYADWTTAMLHRWKDALQRSGISPRQQLRDEGGRTNDRALVMDAIEIMLAHQAESFCLISLDKHYTGLAGRLKLCGLPVHGFGGRGTVRRYRKICDEFVFIEPATVEMRRA